MTTLEKMRAEIARKFFEHGFGNTKVCYEVLQIIDKYAEQKNCDTCINNGKCSPQIREIVRKNGCPKWTPNKDMYEPLLPMGKYPKTSFPCDSEDDVKQTKQEPCEDAVSRQAVLDCFTATKLKKFDFILYAREEIKKLPPVTPQPKIGHWIEKYNYLYVCSECGQYMYSETEHDREEFHAFCGRCGAKMVEPQESEDKE